MNDRCDSPRDGRAAAQRRPASIRDPRSAIRNRPAFTMVELLVAMAVTIGIILFINEVIGNVQQGVSAGLGLSNIIEDARAIDAQIAIDAKTIVPPGGGGVLVIVNQKVSAGFGPGDTATSKRIDQIMWIRSTSETESVAPGYPNSYAGSPEARQGFQKIWYGHALQTTPAGLVAASAFGVANTPDQYAVNWHLARHGMFFDPTISSGVANADGGRYDATTTSFGGTDTVPAGVNKVYMSITDVADFGFSDPDPTNGAMVGGLASSYTAGQPGNCMFTDDTAGSYSSKALNYVFRTERLRVNPRPSAPYEAWKYGQLVPILAQRVVEFAVSFAGDYDGNGVTDTFTSGPFANAIKWYDAFSSDSTADDVDAPPVSASGFAGTGGGASAQPIFDSTSNAFVFRHGAGVTRWPTMVRIRYRITDRQARIAGADGNPGRIFEQIIRIPQ